jgi:putative membrane-bound dehydrogenase-like protein
MHRLIPIMALAAVSSTSPLFAQTDAPQAHDKRLVVELFAQAPDIVHPIALDFDARGRLLVIESHTHFPPKEYKGLKHDRVRMLEDTDGDGRADRFTTFFEGTVKTMDIAVHRDGDVYLATRNEVLRLRDTDGDGKADEKERVVFLDTKGDYPHNGLSGLCFDERGDLYFGMGENLGERYKLIGADGVTVAGEGDGGHVFHCCADGTKLRRIATGFWNPFGICRDIHQNFFVVDNDPDAAPPCRLLHLVEGGDYGFQFRYGRQGRHPFQAWNGELPGTLPMISGTGEAPCEVLSYESDGLPDAYLGDLLVTAWADHRVERYRLRPKGQSFTAERLPFVEGGKDFRPVGLAVAPDGSLFVSDWVLRDYTLHQRGAIWHVRQRDAKPPVRPTEPRAALQSWHRPLRETAARRLVQDEASRGFLQRLITDKAHGPDRLEKLNVRIVAAVRQALIGRGNHDLRTVGPEREVLLHLSDDDPFVRNAGVQELARSGALSRVDARRLQPVQRLGVLLAHRAVNAADTTKVLPGFLADPDEDVRFLAVKWVADEKLTQHRALIARALEDPKLNVRMYWALATALARLDGQEVNENKLADLFLGRAVDGKTAAAVRVLALQLVPARHKRMSLDVLGKLLREPEPMLQTEAVRALGEHPEAGRAGILLKTAADCDMPTPVRAQAVAGLADVAGTPVAELLTIAEAESDLKADVLRTLVNVALNDAQRVRVKALGGELAARVLGEGFYDNRPSTKDTAAWLKLLEGPADAEAGRRIFAQPRLAYCARCHRVEGRGADVGPDLSTIGRTERRHILESILQPSTAVAPHYQAWLLETADGLVRSGMLVHTNLDEYTYLDEKGGRFKVNTRDIASMRALATSIMPDGLVERLTDQELRDLLAYLCSRR